MLKPFKANFNQTKSRTLMSGGVIFTYLATGKETNGKCTIFEAKGIPGMEPPPHTHTKEDESFYILEGKLLFTIGEEEVLAEAGDFVFLPRNIRHQFKVLTPFFHCISSVYPAGLENYFAPLSIPYDSNDIPPINTSPPSQEAVEMMQKLNEEFGITYHE